MTTMKSISHLRDRINDLLPDELIDTLIKPPKVLHIGRVPVINAESAGSLDRWEWTHPWNRFEKIGQPTVPSVMGTIGELLSRWRSR
jgi:hypothetical protein